MVSRSIYPTYFKNRMKVESELNNVDHKNLLPANTLKLTRFRA